MKRTNYLSYTDPLDGTANTRQSQFAEVELARRYGKILGRHGDHQLNANLSGAVVAQINNKRHKAGTGGAASFQGNIQPVIASRFASELPRFGRGGPKLQASGLMRERSYPERDGQSLTRFD